MSLESAPNFETEITPEFNLEEHESWVMEQKQEARSNWKGITYRSLMMLATGIFLIHEADKWEGRPHQKSDFNSTFGYGLYQRKSSESIDNRPINYGSQKI